mmetsp:Transcript_50445/g.74825  ORF Transcript_50445/g.74825 Transcript_50445/m.74825 type:complete len:473 (+) Transcript_50445:182-1600(+)|eukprot:CAMPEP_0195509910 /NCGR_PEP_ID=MMETSP0794_2-20130614/2700_1 /TAXON_ID=515487 /ORGANISM="Stephanopyxis turris, Strain CCMP 815" /LENGTH=472 /DNA_ID=CAMNT_0040637235 /DNA_START=216 /DNA_END=1634 /DNA_ORIENTATION=+
MGEGDPRVVQGVAVASTYDGNTDTATYTKGEMQPKRCRDPLFAFIFYVQIAAIVVCAVIYGPHAQESYTITGTNITTNFIPYLDVAGATGVFAFILSGLMLFVMMCIANFLIKAALIFEIVLTLAWAIFGFMIGNFLVGIFGVIFFLIGLCYARAVWSRIPFATANLITGLTAVKANFGVSIIAYFFAILSFAWFMLWALVTVGIYVATTCDDVTGVCTGSPNGGFVFLLFLSFFFTTQVLQNCVHVTVAGTVGTWWFDPESASCCCSSAVLGSSFRTLTTSFGSICFGSLLVAILQALRQMANEARNNDNGILICIAECILSCLESILEYFNKWAFIYVGLYGYSYLEAGKNVMTLFQNRGWEAVIADDLVGNVLFLISVVVGGVTGGVGILLLHVTDWFPDDTGINSATAFGFGFIIGLVVTSILMSTVASAVNTVIVCFAEGPAEFDTNHPELSRKMREAWLGAFPDYM